MSLKEFILTITSCNTIDDVLQKYESASEKGFVYERLWDIIIKFGFCSKFPNFKFTHKLGNMNTGSFKNLVSIQNYLETNKIISGNSGGYSDISLYDNQEETYYFLSSKFTNSEKSVDYYDVQNIITAIESNKEIYKKYKILLLVSDKEQVLEKVRKSNTSSLCITKHMNEDTILDKKDLEKYFLEFKNTLSKYTFEDYDEIFLSKKENLYMRFHQEFITQKTLELIQSNQKQFLWGCKCRSGKTYMVGGLITKQKSIKDGLNVLIITPAPTETTPQFTEDLFQKFRDFKDFAIHSIESSSILSTVVLSKNNIFITSKQLLQRYINENTIVKIKDLNLDLIVFDENHFSGTTNLSKDILKSYSSENTVRVYLTATYNKPLKEWNIPEECQMYWDIEDEQFCKSYKENLDNLVEKHGDCITTTIQKFKTIGKSNDDIFNPYLSMPNLHLITTMFDQERYDTLISEIKENDSKYGFSFDTLFSINKKTKKFNFENQVKTLLQYVSGSEKIKQFPKGDRSLFGRINKLCVETGSRTPFTQIWFLPPNCIDEISVCLKDVTEKDKILKNYDIMIINSKQKIPKDIKLEIEKQEMKSIDEGKLGLILLAGNMLSLGITLKNCDVVFLFNNTLSCDKVMQQMYRCMTEGKEKQIGIVIDLNISRVLNTCINYGIYKKDLSIEDKVKYIVNNHLIDIDKDLFENKEINTDILVSRMMDLWKSDPINSFTNLLSNLDNEYIEFDIDTQRILNKNFTSSSGDKTGESFKVDEEIDQPIPNGREVVIDTESDSSEESEDSDSKKSEEIKEIQISFVKDVLPYVIPLACILTYKDKNKDFIKMLTTIQNNPELLEIFNEQSLIWWNKKNLIEIVKSITEKNFAKTSNIFNISIQFKMALQSLIDHPKELLELINDCLKPKDVEKKQFGEVFTPMTLVNEMLDKLPKEVWTKKDLTWFDPAAGMGNFPIAVYLRLMESLKEIFPEKEERKRHIIEKMLYMAEINKKNCYLIREIFNVNNDYKLNLYEGDSLKLDIQKEFNLKNFDIIVGNPPYNASGKKASGNTIWQNFVITSLKLLNSEGHLCFIHPNGWRKPNTEKGKFFGLFEKLSKDNTIIYLEIHDTKDGMKQFKCGTRYDWYILNKKKNENYKTKIIDQDKISYEIDLSKYNWLANSQLDLIDKLIANNNEEKCKILQSMSAYEPRKKWISKTETKEFKYPVIHSTPKDKPRLIWSNKNDNGFYGIKKIIFGDSGINNPVIDLEGKYAMSQHAMAITIDSLEEGEKLSNFLCSSMFEKILKSCLWSSFAIEWGMFKDFKKDFYTILEENLVIEKKEENESIIIKEGRKKFYLIKTLISKDEDNKIYEYKVYKVKKDNSVGDFVGDYKDGKIIEKSSKK